VTQTDDDNARDHHQHQIGHYLVPLDPFGAVEGWSSRRTGPLLRGQEQRNDHPPLAGLWPR
jgi:hypothetical protein